MNARRLASRILASLAVMAALSTLSGCVVYSRPARYHHSWYR
jgi:hypothetical protein